jgi:hypothetical protein
VVTAPESAPAQTHTPGLLGKLMAAVRPEFRANIIAPRRALMFDELRCQVSGCARDMRSQGLCNGHYLGWWRQGCPNIDEFITTAVPLQVGGPGLAGCLVPGCRHGVNSRGLCHNHYQRWRRAGEPNRDLWLSTITPVTGLDHRDCALSFCSLWTFGRSQFCRVHALRWRRLGEPDLDDYAALLESYGNDRFDFRCFGERRQLKLEMQYAFQCRLDERKVKTSYGVGRAVLAFVAAAEVDSLLDWPMDRWSDAFSTTRRFPGNHLGFLRYAYRCIEDLQAGTGWDAEYHKDVWELRSTAEERLAASSPHRSPAASRVTADSFPSRLVTVVLSHQDRLLSMADSEPLSAINP